MALEGCSMTEVGALPRALVLGNGRLLVNFDDKLNMRDLYYPRVGMNNHILGHRNSLGVWVDGEFDWIDSPSWQRRIGYEDDTLIGHATAHNETARHRAGHPGRGALPGRPLSQGDSRRQPPAPPPGSAAFFTHDFCIDESDIGDTTYYDPGADAIIHYKRDKWFLMSGLAQDRGIFQYANGTKRFAGAEGTWRDAEDGWLEGNPIAQGSVDSCISFQSRWGPWASGSWSTGLRLAAASRKSGASPAGASRAAPGACSSGTAGVLAFLARQGGVGLQRPQRRRQSCFKRSLLVIRTQIDRGGAIVAANDSDILHFNRDHYSYMWPRDGALVSYALDRAGYSELHPGVLPVFAGGASPKGDTSAQVPSRRISRFELASLAFGGRSSASNPRGRDRTGRLCPLAHFTSGPGPRFRPSSLRLSHQARRRSLWQLPGQRTGLPWKATIFGRKGGASIPLRPARVGRAPGGRPLCPPLRRNGRSGKYEKRREVREGILQHLWVADLRRFARGVWLWPTGSCPRHHLGEQPLRSPCLWRLAADHPQRQEHHLADRRRADRQDACRGGVARYERDYYFAWRHHADVPGNPWFICTLWLADSYIGSARTKADLKRPKEIIEWCAKRALPSGLMPEQLHPVTGEPLSVAPLTWSHSTYISTVLKYFPAHARDRRTGSDRGSVARSIVVGGREAA